MDKKLSVLCAFSCVTNEDILNNGSAFCIMAELSDVAGLHQVSDTEDRRCAKDMDGQVPRLHGWRGAAASGRLTGISEMCGGCGRDNQCRQERVSVIGKNLNEQ